MDQTERRRLIEKIHRAPTRMVLSVAGGALALAELQMTPGASNTLLEGLAPYSGPAIRELLGAEVEPSHVSEAGASALARACLGRALGYVSGYGGSSSGSSSGGAGGGAGNGAEAPPFEVIGVSCTAALATQRQRRGDDRAWMAIARSSPGSAEPQVVACLVEFEAGSVAGNGVGSQQDSYYERRMTQERQLADELLGFIADNVADNVSPSVAENP